MHLANNEHKFYCKIQGEKTMEWFEGDFVVKCILTNEEQVDIAIRTDRYNAGSKTLPTQHTLINRTIAELEVRIMRDAKGKLQAPTWWIESDGGRLLYDTNVLYHVFAEAMKAEQVFAQRLKDKAEAAEKLAGETNKDEK